MSRNSGSDFSGRAGGRPSAVRDGQVTFTAENPLRAADGGEICKQTSRLTLAARPGRITLLEGQDV